MNGPAQALGNGLRDESTKRVDGDPRDWTYPLGDDLSSAFAKVTVQGVTLTGKLTTNLIS
jgi:hypothetical protein